MPIRLASRSKLFAAQQWALYTQCGHERGELLKRLRCGRICPQFRRARCEGLKPMPKYPV